MRLFLFREIWLLVFVGDNCIVEWHLCVVYEKVFSFASSLVILGKVICNCIIREQLGLFCKKSTYVSSLCVWRFRAFTKYSLITGFK